MFQSISQSFAQSSWSCQKTISFFVNSDKSSLGNAVLVSYRIPKRQAGNFLQRATPELHQSPTSINAIPPYTIQFQTFTCHTIQYHTIPEYTKQYQAITHLWSAPASASYTISISGNNNSLKLFTSHAGFSVFSPAPVAPQAIIPPSGSFGIGTWMQKS